MNRSNLLFVFFFVLAGSSIARPQSSARPATPLAASASTAVPALVPFSGVAVDAAGKPLGEAGSITFQVFKDEHGGEPLWAETQTVTLDLAGRYTVRLGASSANGIPTDLFQTGEARWLEVQKVRNLVALHTDLPQLGLFGEPGVNVLELNLALDAVKK